jgi:hypothetical protein
MKNIHLIPTDKPNPNILLKKDDGTFKIFDKAFYDLWKAHQEFGDFAPSNATYQNIYITSNEEIKEGDWCLLDHNVGISEGYEVLKCDEADTKNGWYSFGNMKTGRCKKIILTTDQDLIADGVQAIDDTFFEWFVKNPSCDEVDVNDWLDTNGNIAWGGDKRYQICTHLYDKIIISQEEPKSVSLIDVMKSLQEQWQKDMDKSKEDKPGINAETFQVILSEDMFPKQETLEEASKDYIENTMKYSFNSLETKTFANRLLKCAEFGAKWQAERMYSEEDMINCFNAAREYRMKNVFTYEDSKDYIKSLNKEGSPWQTLT